MDAETQKLLVQLTRRRLMSADEAKALFRRWRKEVKADAAVRVEFDKWLVRQELLTDYQAKLLSQGRADGFFLGQYKILERIGRGRMAGVYKAVHRLGQVVALKVLPPSRAKDPHLMGRFQREAKLALKLSHPNTVRAYQVGQVDGHNFLVMEYLEGETFEELLERRKKLEVPEAVGLIHQALLGLEHLREQGVVHRDLKPANLMVVRSPHTTAGAGAVTGIVKILDIGLGRAMYDETSPESGEDPQLTAAGAVLGTPDYMAPEQGRNARAADIRADIYSLGCVLFHLLAGQPPFPDTNLISQMIRHATEPVRSLKEFNPQVSDALQQVIERMMAKDPGQRYASPKAAAAALEPFMGPSADASPAPPTEPQLQTYLTWLQSQAPSDQSPSTIEVDMSRAAGSESKSPSITRAAPVAAAPQRVKPPRPASPPIADPADEFDVELVPITQPEEAPAAGPFQLTRRDLLMIGSGAGGVLLAVFVGWGLAQLLRKKDKQEP